MAENKIQSHGIIERFEYPGQEGYSEFWRKNKSPLEIHELAQLLSGLRKVTSYVGTNVGDIVWSGMEAANAIALDPAPLLGQYPVPAAKTDLMVGIAIQRAYEKTEWSERLRRLAMAKAKLPVRYAYKFQLFLSMCERVYLDCLSNRSVLGFYTEIARRNAIEQAEKIWSHPPTIGELLNIWWDLAADRKGLRYKEAFRDRSVRRFSQNTSLEKYYTAPIELLNSIVDRLVHECPKIFGVSERCNYRMELYYSIWPQLFEIIKYWATDSNDPYLQNSRTARERENFEPGTRPQVPVWFPEQVQNVIAKHNAEFTQRVKEVVNNKDDVVRIKENNIVMPARKCVHKKLLHKLSFVIRTAAQKKTTFNRGLRTGKIDRRRLYRAPTTGTIFQFNQHEFQLVNDISLLVDATGSMAAPNRWEKAEAIYQTLFSAIHDFNKNARLFAYNEVKSVCRLTELFVNRKFFSILPHGKTASGEAIIVVARDFTKGSRKPFIIHLTDGASNWGCGVANAIQFCKRKGINLLTLGMGCDASSKSLLIEEYGNLVQFVDHIEAMPQLLRDLLKKSKWS